MKVKQHKVTPAKKKNKILSRAKKSKGMVDAGTVYGILLLSLIVGAGIMILGNTTPKATSTDSLQPVITKGPDLGPSRTNLQLEDFPGVTITPTPTPTATPTPTPTTPPPATGGGGGGGGGTTCFIKGTKVLLADGKQKNIEEIRVGDKVLSFNGSKNVAETVQELDAPIRDHYYSVKLADGTVLGVTDEHPLYTLNGWKAINPDHTKQENASLIVGKLSVGDKVLNSSGKYVAINEMVYHPGSVQAYNLKKVSGFNNFYANSVLAHNKGGGGSGGGSSGGSAL